MADHAQQIIWTALPNGITRKGAQLSVHVSPRLTVEGVPTTDLFNYPAWTDWPSTVSTARFGVRFGRQRVAARLISKPDSAVWKAIFQTHTLDINHAFEDLSDKVMVAYSASAMLQRLRNVYRDVAGSYVDDLPDVSVLRDALDPFQAAPSGPDLLKNIATDGGKDYLGELAKAGLADLGLFHAYHAPFDPLPKPLSPIDARPQRDGIDFHQLVAALAQYGRLLRDTGLVLDLDLELERPLQHGEGPLSVDAEWDGGRGVKTRPNVSPRTRTILDAKRFEAVPRGTHIKGLRLDLSDPRYVPVQIDLDGGIIKLSGTGQSLRTREALAGQSQGKNTADQAPTGLPTLRSAGIMVAEDGRADALSDRMTHAATFEQAVQTKRPVELFAEDVTRGYHIDVREGRAWHSICRVDVTYDFKDGEQLREKDVEGIVQLSASEAPPGSAPELDRVLRFSEGLFLWDGWSLSAPRPGLALDQAGRPQPGEETADLPVSAKETVHPKSLPKLRFGATYRIRARLVDLAHNAEPWAARDTAGATKEITYRRFEPLAPPVPALVLEAGQVDVPERGASLLRMVIRTGEDQQVPTTDTDVRLIFPPRASVEMAERHGALDGPDGRPRPDRYSLLAGRDDDLETVEAGPPEERRTYPVANTTEPTAPWLPDPMAVQVQVTLKSDPPRFVNTARNPFSNEAGAQVEAGAAWPDQRPWTLKLQEDAARPERYIPHQGIDLDLNAATIWDEQTRTLTVSLPKGEIVRAKLAHMFPGKPEPADFWGIADWLRSTLDLDVYQSMADAINAGRHWAITPALELELVHAVQRPLTAFHPNFSPPLRTRGDTHADLFLTSPCHAESTADLTLEGAWIEAEDTKGNAPSAGWRSGRAFRKILGDDVTPQGIIQLNDRHAFGDTRYRRISYRLRGSSRFTEYFPPGLPNAPSSFDSVSDDVVVHVPNSAPPPAPKVAGAVPVFDWLRDTVGTRKASWRRSGIRVYVERPWFETGFGEMLAAVVPTQQMTNTAFENLSEGLTTWAGDPIWLANGRDGEVRTTAPRMADFPSRSHPADGPDERWPDVFPAPERDLSGGNPVFHNLALTNEDGIEIARVDAAGHPVSRDPDGRQYYADLMMSTGRVYQPFVSLAVARLHPISAPGCHLSPSVRVETQQVLPARLAVCRRSSVGWTVQLFGHLHGFEEGEGLSGSDRPLGSAVRVEVQRARGAEIDELDWETIEDTALATAPDARALDPNVQIALPSGYTPNFLFPGRNGSLRDDLADFLADAPKRLYSRRFKTPGAGGGAATDYRWRIRITEWERHKGDSGPGNLRKTPSETERLVFAETFDVTP